MPARVENTEDGCILRVEYSPAPGIAPFLHDPALVTGYFGPLGCGKTTAGVMKTALYAQAWPGARILIARTTWPNLRDTTQRAFFEWLPDGIAGHYHHTKQTFFLQTAAAPAEILFRALEDDRDIENVLSLDLAAAWIDEPQGGIVVPSPGAVRSEPGISHKLFLQLLGRVGRQPGYPGFCWLTGNPPAPTHWITKEFRYAGAGHPTNPRRGFHLYLGDKQTNWMHLPSDYYERLEDLFGVGTPMARRFIEGDWIEFALLNPFKAEWILYWDQLPPWDDLYAVLGVDPAVKTTDESSRTALVGVAQALRGPEATTAFVTDYLAGHWSPYEQADQLIKLCQRRKYRKVRIEDVAWQAALKDIVQREAELRGVRLPSIELAKPKGDKLLRASQWSPLVESGRVLFGPGQQGLVDALLAVPMDPTMWDPVDAAGLALGGLPRSHAPRSRLGEPPSAKTAKRVESYAMKGAVPLPWQPVRMRGPGGVWHPFRPARDPRRRAKGYAVRAHR